MLRASPGRESLPHDRRLAGGVDEALPAEARHALAGYAGLRFVLGGAGTGKSTVCAALSALHGLEILDIDARLYGSWHGRFDPARHPANHAWSSAADPLAWQVALEPEAFLAFHEAATAEALDLLADELRGADPARPLLVDGGFGSVAVVARAVPSSVVVCLALPPDLAATVWTGDEDRRGFLDVVAGIADVDDPVTRFLALDATMSARMVADARAAGVRVIERLRGEPVDSTAARVAEVLGVARA
jgi:hypothetical protein